MSRQWARGDVSESGGEHRFRYGATTTSIADRLWQACGRRPHTKDNDTCVSHTSQNGTPRHQNGGRRSAYGAVCRCHLSDPREAQNTQHRFFLGFSYESVCCFIDCSKEATRVESADHDVCEIKREDGVTIRLHFSSGGVTLQECMVRILEKHIEKSTKS